MVLKLVKIREYEMGLYFHDRGFRGLLEPGRYWFFDPLGRVRVDVASQRTQRGGAYRCLDQRKPTCPGLLGSRSRSGFRQLPPALHEQKRFCALR